jgi:hypothetical protein
MPACSSEAAFEVPDVRGHVQLCTCCCLPAATPVTKAAEHGLELDKQQNHTHRYLLFPAGRDKLA